MKIGFFNNQIDERGTTWQSYLYAKYARNLLGHETAVFYPSTTYHSFLKMKANDDRPFGRWIQKIKFNARVKAKSSVHFDVKMAERIKQDGIPVIEIALDADFSHLDALYHIKSGENDGFIPRGTRYWVHAVYNVSQPHGDRYVAISSWLGKQQGIPFVPHIVEVTDDLNNLRQELGIPRDAIVFGRFGGRDSFDIPWVWSVIKDSLAHFNNVYFLFANTDIKLQHSRIICLPSIYDMHQKRRFINTCDAMLHARIRGETFGLAVGEFALCGKPVLTYAKSPEQAHPDMLSHPLLYSDEAELKELIGRCSSGGLPQENGGAYQNCTPEKVMAIFDKHFIR